MKSIKLTIIAIFVFTALANAQVFVGGSFGIGGRSTSTTSNGTTVKGDSYFNFSFNPQAGVFITDDFIVGAKLGFGINRHSDRQPTATIERASSFGVAAFADYIFARFGKFSVMAEASVPFIFSWHSTETGGTKTKQPNVFVTGIGIRPHLLFGLNDHITLLTSLNFLSANFNLQTSTIDGDGAKVRKTDPSFNLGVNADNILNIGAITIGAIYIF